MYQLFSFPIENPVSGRHHTFIADVICKSLLNMARFLDEYAKPVLEEFIISLELGMAGESGYEWSSGRMSLQKMPDDLEAVSERCRGILARHLQRIQ